MRQVKSAILCRRKVDRCRKVRWARKGVGKSGGVRVIYFTRTAAGQIILLTIYAKATTANLTPAQLKELRYDYEKNLAFKR